MLKVGLTGSIAVGKSHVCDRFRALGCHVLDADRTARDVVEPGTVGLSKIVEHFGKEVLEADGSLDRMKLGSIIFADGAKRELLNSIVHPLVIEKQNAWIEEIEQEDPDGIAVVDAALLIESGGYRRFDKLIVVWCEPEIQLKRLMKRDGLSETAARQRIDAQMSQDKKKTFADFLIDTSNSFEVTQLQVEEVHLQLRRLAA
jgi:dephospho-CoA kinase